MVFPRVKENGSVLPMGHGVQQGFRFEADLLDLGKTASETVR